MTKNNQGFTLIELLAVVVIIGILSVVAVSAVTRIMENTRKDMFIGTTKEYANAVQKMWVGDNLHCGSKGTISSDVEPGDYYILIDSKNQDLLEDGGKSSWGNKDMKGYVKVNVSIDAKGNKKTKYYVATTDGIHGVKEVEKKPEELGRNDLIMNINSISDFDKRSETTCVLDGYGTDKKIANIEGNIDEVGSRVEINGEYFRIMPNLPGDDSSKVKLFAEKNLSKSSNPPIQKDGNQNVNLGSPVFWTYNGGNPYVYDNTNPKCSISKYIDNYVEYLKESGITNITGRLPKYEEVDDLWKNHGKPKWSYSTWYWTGSAATSNYAWFVRSYGSFFKTYPYMSNSAGARPVIIIPKSEL